MFTRKYTKRAYQIYKKIEYMFTRIIFKEATWTDPTQQKIKNRTNGYVGVLEVTLSKISTLQPK